MKAGAASGAVLGAAVASGLLLILVALASPSHRTGSRRSGSMRGLAARAGVPWLTPGRLVLACIALGFASAAIALVMSALPVLALLAGLIGSMLPVLLLRRRADQLDRAIRTAWPEAIDALVSGVRAGMSLSEALGALAERGPQPLRPGMSGFVAEMRATGSFAEAMHSLQDRLADPIADRVVACLLIARDVGGSDLGRVLRNLSTLIREDARVRAEIEGRQSWTVSAARLAVAAPWITVALLCTRSDAVQAYRTPVGACVLLGAAAVSVVAYRLMIRIGRLPTERRVVS